MSNWKVQMLMYSKKLVQGKSMTFCIRDSLDEVVYLLAHLNVVKTMSDETDIIIGFLINAFVELQCLHWSNSF